MEESKLEKKVKERVEYILDFQYHDWDDMIECDEIPEEEIKKALSKLQVTWK